MARNELSLVKLRERIEGRPARAPVEGAPEARTPSRSRPRRPDGAATEGWASEPGRPARSGTTRLVVAKQQLNDAVEDLLDVIRNPDVLAADRQRPTGPTSPST